MKNTSPLTHVSVNRMDKHTVEISWESLHGNTDVSIYMGYSPENIDRSQPIAHITNENSTEINGLDPLVRYYFEIVSQDCKGVNAAERKVPMEGAINFRDLGGYKTTDGHHVKWGKIFRSNKLNTITNKDQALLKQIGIKLVCDFRVPGEGAKEPDILPADGSIEHLPLPITHGEFDTIAATEKIQKGDTDWLTDAFMIEGYKKNIDDFAATWGEVFHRLAEPENHPLVFHCNAGKDRAGTCAALILLALGVPEKTIIYDYTLSNVFLARWVEAIHDIIREAGIDPQILSPFLVVKAEYIVALLNHIRETYGSASHYLKTRANVSNITLDRLRNELLE